MADEFIELDYTGKADGFVFDTTRQSDADPSNKGPFGPVVIKLGIGQLLPGLDTFLADKKPGTYEVTLPAEEAFGKKDAKLFKLVPLQTFGKEARQLEPGISVRIGEQSGIVKSISGGRVVVDFNHPLAGKTVEYSLQVHGVVQDPKKKVESIVKAMLGVALPVTDDNGTVTVSIPKGFPNEGFAKEIEKQTGVLVAFKEVELAHDHAGHDHSHAGHDHNHEGHDHTH